MAKKNSIVVGLDIGTSKVCAVVGEMTERGGEGFPGVLRDYAGSGIQGCHARPIFLRSAGEKRTVSRRWRVQ